MSRERLDDQVKEDSREAIRNACASAPDPVNTGLQACCKWMSLWRIANRRGDLQPDERKKPPADAGGFRKPREWVGKSSLTHSGGSGRLNTQAHLPRYVYMIARRALRVGRGRYISQKRKMPAVPRNSGHFAWEMGRS